MASVCSKVCFTEQSVNCTDISRTDSDIQQCSAYITQPGTPASWSSYILSVILSLRSFVVLRVLIFKDALSVMQQKTADVLCAGLLIQGKQDIRC